VSDSPGERRDAPDLAETLQALGATGRAGLSAAGDAAKALRILVAADIALARSALGRTLALTGVAIAFGASAWLLLMATLIVALSRGLGWPWPLSLLLTAALSIAVALFAGWRAMHYFEHTRLKATRRQFARLGLGELADLMPDADAAASSADASDAPIKHDLGVDVPPP
jgi:membrane protein implicated in regulation of membrane protease activity